jgi:hypothetical protein
MTFVVAKRFGERILIASDTMISDLEGTRHDVIPGRLKAVILDPKTTVAYSGLPDQGIDAVRQAKELLSAGRAITDVEQMLAAATAKFPEDLDFLIASHRDGVALKRIWEGTISCSLDETCIGERNLLSGVLKQESDSPRSVVPNEFEDEGRFLFGFHKLYNGLYVSKSVGGFGVMVTCSPYGHFYLDFGAITCWDTIQIPPGLTEQQLADRRSGKTSWNYSIIAPTLRGVGVVGALIADAGVGYLYSPLHQDSPIECRFPRPTEHREHGLVQEEFRKQIDDIADKVGGGIEDMSPPASNRAPTEFEFQQIEAYAAAAALPTRVSREGDSIWICCNTPRTGRGVRVGFSSLNPDPVSVLATTIDRLNAEILGELAQAEAETNVSSLKSNESVRE